MCRKSLWRFAFSDFWNWLSFEIGLPYLIIPVNTSRQLVQKDTTHLLVQLCTNLNASNCLEVSGYLPRQERIYEKPAALSCAPGLSSVMLKDPGVFLSEAVYSGWKLDRPASGFWKFLFRKSRSYCCPAYEFCFNHMWFSAAKRLALKKPGSDPFEGQKLRDFLDMPGCVHRVRFMKFDRCEALQEFPKNIALLASAWLVISGQEVNLFWRIVSHVFLSIFHVCLYPTLFLTLIASPYAGVVRSGLADDTDFLDEVGCQQISTSELNINGELPIQSEVIIILDSV